MDTTQDKFSCLLELLETRREMSRLRVKIESKGIDILEQIEILARADELKNRAEELTSYLA